MISTSAEHRTPAPWRDRLPHTHPARTYSNLIHARVPPTTPLTESAGLSHDAAGLLSVRRGGGTFDFGITSAPTPEDDADFAVIGRVVEGMDSVAALDAVTIVKAADVLNADGGLDPKGSRGKVCEYANPQPFCAQGKPLKKITLLRSSVL